MPQFKKAILKVGRYESPDGVVDVTPERLRHWARMHKTMRARNLAIPVGFDHSDNPTQQLPVAFSSDRNKALSAINAVGQMIGFDVAKDGHSAQITLDLPDRTAAQKAEQNVVEVSPIIHQSWKDGRGNKYTDIIGHMDLVVHPVDNSQTPFEAVAGEAIACSLRMNLDGKPNIFRMAEDSAMDDEKEKEKPEFMSEDTEGDDTPPVDSEAPEVPDMPNVDDTGDEQLTAIVAHLNTLGVALPEDTTKENFYDRLLTSLKTVEAMTAKSDADEAKESTEDEEPSDEESEMKVADPQFTAMSLQAKAAFNFASSQHRLGLEKRIDALLNSGRCSAADAKAKKESLGGVKLSLNGKGEAVKSLTERWIDDRESLPAGAVWEPSQRMSLNTAQVAEPSAAMVGDQFNDAKVAEVAAWAMGRKATA